MFVQIITGTVTDPQTFLREGERWAREVRPNAIGYLGGVWGLTSDGRGLAVGQFESEQAAQANSTRPEQGEWWTSMEKAFSDVTFVDCSDTDVMGEGIATAAGFAQVIQGRVKDQSATKAMMRENEEELRAGRPDILGGLMAWHGTDGTFTQVMFFRSEADARSGEKAMESQDVGRQYQEMMATAPTFIDLPEPHFD